MVRCARCNEQWVPVALAEEPEVPEPAPASLADEVATPGLPQPLVPPVPRQPARPWALIGAWAGSAALIVCLIAAAIVWRQPIMQTWPPSTRLYSALGLVS